MILSPTLHMYVYIIHLGTFMSYFWGMTWIDPKITSIMTMLWNFLLFFFPSSCVRFRFGHAFVSFASKNITLHLQVLIHYLFIHRNAKKIATLMKHCVFVLCAWRTFARSFPFCVSLLSLADEFSNKIFEHLQMF